MTTLLSAFAIVLLPRQFHVAVVENHDQRGIRTAAWLFPTYLVLINLFVAPLAIAGLNIFPDGSINRDLTVLALPLNAGAHGIALLTMVGGLSAATGMVVVESVALAITISNDLVMPLVLRRRGSQARAVEGDIGALVLWVRRVAIVGVLALGFAYERMAGEAGLVSIGLLSFAAVAQIAPAFLGGLFWRRGTARGAIAGMTAGALAWFYLLLLPSIRPEHALSNFLAHGPLAIAWLSPAALVAFAPNALVGGVVLSLAANIAAFFVFSLTRQPSALERAQASAFAGVGVGGKPQAFRLWRSSTTAGELEAAVARYLGAGRARRAFAGFMRERGLVYDPTLEASAQLVRHAEFLLSPAIGASTSRQVLSLLLRPRTVSGQSALKLIDEASAAIQSSRDQLQHALDHARQGITVFDANLALTAWNREFADLFDLPPAMLRHGVGLDEIVRFNAGRGAYGPGDSEDFVADRVASLLYDDQPNRLRLFSTHRVIEVRSARLPDGGIVTTYTDVTQTVQVEEALEAANEMLERRVDERTAELQRLNAELERAKNEADAANLSKTRFLAAASHDILQPLNAARLYASSLSEGASQIGRRGAGGSGAQRRCLARGGRGDPRRAARHFAARRRRDPAGNLRRPGRRPDGVARNRVRRPRPGQGTRPRLRPDQARHPHRPAADAAPAAEPHFERAQIYAERPGAGRVPAALAARSGSRCGTPASAFRPSMSGRCSPSSGASIRGRGSRAASASAYRSSSAWGGCSSIRSDCARAPARGRCSSSPRRSDARRLSRAQSPARPSRSRRANRSAG